MFQEFPKMLVQGDQHTTVQDAAQEADARAAGFAVYGEEVKPAKADKPAKHIGKD
ncbi:MAG: hypothetical protein ABIR55_05455 [Burkholderiaceae bacterium]